MKPKKFLALRELEQDLAQRSNEYLAEALKFHILFRSFIKNNSFEELLLEHVIARLRVT